MSPGSLPFDPSLREAQEAVAAYHDKHGLPADLLRSECRGPGGHLPEAHEVWVDVWTKAGDGRIGELYAVLDALSDRWDAMDPVQLALSLGDAFYAVFQIAVTAGVDLASIFTELHRSRMTESASPQASTPEHPHGDDYEPPKIGAVLLSQRIDIVNRREKHG